MCTGAQLCRTPAHNALHCQVGLASGRSLGRDWRRCPGRPRARWTEQLRNDTGSVPANLWRQTNRPSYGAMVERRDGPRWLRDDDDDDDSFAANNLQSGLSSAISVESSTLRLWYDRSFFIVANHLTGVSFYSFTLSRLHFSRLRRVLYRGLLSALFHT